MKYELTSKPAATPSGRFGHVLRLLPAPALLASGVALLCTSFAHAAGSTTLGAMVQSSATDLEAGAGYGMTAMGYVLGGAALLASLFTFWKHSQNANGPYKLGYAVSSLLVGGAFLGITYIATGATNTMVGASPDNTGAAAKMTFNR